MKNVSVKTTDRFRSAHLRAQAEAKRVAAKTMRRGHAMKAIAASYERIAERAEALVVRENKKG